MIPGGLWSQLEVGLLIGHISCVVSGLMDRFDCIYKTSVSKKAPTGIFPHYFSSEPEYLNYK